MQKPAIGGLFFSACAATSSAGSGGAAAMIPNPRFDDNPGGGHYFGTYT
jgi:hypothetical protein